MVEYLTRNMLSRWMGLKNEPAKTVFSNAASGQPDINMGENVVFFSVGDTILIADSATPIGEILVIESIASTTITCTTNLVNSYATSRNAKVEPQSHWTPRSSPPSDIIDDLIEMNEEVLDKDIHTSYKRYGISTTEYLTFLVRGGINYPYYSMPLRYPLDTQTPMEFKRKSVLPLDPSRGDKLFYLWGDEWKDALDPDSGIRVWEDVIDNLVTDFDMEDTAPFVITPITQPRISTTLRWSLTHANISAFQITIVGVDFQGNVKTEVITQANGWYGHTVNFFSSITSITVDSMTDDGENDTFNLTTEKDKSRMAGDYDCWIDYTHAIFYPKNLIVDSGQKTAEVTYRYSMYHSIGDRVPKDIQKMMLYLCGIDLLGNERYATNLPGGGGSDQTKVETQINTWTSAYNKMVAKRRVTITHSGYQ